MTHDPPVLADLDDVGRFVVDAKSGTFVFREGDRSTEMYIVQDGRVALSKTWAGEDRVVAVLEPGDFFGENALLEDQPREISARAVTDCRLLRIDHATFDRIVQENPEIAIRMLRKLARRLRERQEADLRAAEIAMGPLAAGAAPSAPPTPAAEGTAARAVLVHAASGRRFALPDGGEVTIGRPDRATGTTPDVDLSEIDPERTLSRRHAKIFRREHQFYLREEMGTRNGTFLNGKRLATGVEVRLRDGDRVRFGLVDMVFECR